MELEDFQQALLAAEQAKKLDEKWLPATATWLWRFKGLRLRLRDVRQLGPSAAQRGAVAGGRVQLHESG